MNHEKMNENIKKILSEDGWFYGIKEENQVHQVKQDFCPNQAMRYDQTIGFKGRSGLPITYGYIYAKENGTYVWEIFHAVTYGPYIGEVKTRIITSLFRLHFLIFVIIIKEIDC